jgi:hypothetical protein
MASLVVLLLIGLAAALVFLGDPEQRDGPKNRGEDPDSEEWEYGDVWKQGSPDEPASENGCEYVELLRGDADMEYNDTTMLDFILYLGSKGIRAKYDSYPLRLLYVLNVEAGKVDEAREYLKEKFNVQNSKFKRF